MNTAYLHRFLRACVCRTALLLVTASTAVAQPTQTMLGALDRSFGTGGQVLTSFGTKNGGLGFAAALARQSDGKVLLAGDNNSDFVIIRVDSTGHLDNTWGGTGKVLVNIDGLRAAASSLAVDTSGNVFVGGSTGSGAAIIELDKFGTLVPTFGTGGMKVIPLSIGLPQTAQGIALDGTGQLVIVGMTVDYDYAITKLNQSGDIVTAFGDEGTVRADVGFSNQRCGKMLAMDAAGAIYVAATVAGLNTSFDFAIYKFDGNGAAVASFGIGGKVLVDVDSASVDTACALELDGLGNIFVVGETKSVFGPRGPGADSDFAIVKLDRFGKLVPTFGLGGRKIIDIAGLANDDATGVSIDSRGRLFVVGGTDRNNGAYAVVALDSNGNLLPAFGAGGIAVINIDGGVGAINAPCGVVFDDKGLLYIGGTLAVSNGSDLAIVKLDRSGTPVPAFGISGVAKFDPGELLVATASSLALDVLGNTLVAGTTEVEGGSAFAVEKLDSHGQLTSTFGTMGKTIYHFVDGSQDSAVGIALDPGGSAYVAGRTGDPFPAFGAVSLGLDGKVALNYGTNGATVVHAAGIDYAQAMTRDAAGNVYIAGYVPADSTAFSIAKLDSHGHPDPTFGVSGASTVTVSDDLLAIPYAMISDLAGNTYVAGVSLAAGLTNAVLIKLDPLGALASDFGVGGRAIIHVDSATQTIVRAIALDDTGAIYLAGLAEINGLDSYLVVKLDSSGNPIPNFGDGGIRLIATELYSDDLVTGVAVDVNHNIFLSGTEDFLSFGVLALDQAGNLVDAFGDAGRTLIGPLGNSTAPYAIALDGYGRALVSGRAGGSRFATIRIFVSAPTKLAVISVNAGLSPTAGSGFDVVVRVQDANGNHHVVTQDTSVNLLLGAGTGHLIGRLNCVVPLGADACTISGVTYSTVESGVVLTATASGGDALSSANSMPFTVTGPSNSNVAFAAAGGVASASSTFGAGFPISAVNNNERAGLNWGNGGGWNDGTGNAFPDWVQINFSGSKTINRVVVYTLQDNYSNPVEPTDTMTFSLYGITAFTVQGRQGTKWITLASVSGNNLVKRTVTFSPFTTTQIRVRVTAALASFSRITEIEAWGN
jgi:uncharacterized delta-60 repeat protein